jgi:hypothetical protein
VVVCADKAGADNAVLEWVAERTRLLRDTLALVNGFVPAQYTFLTERLLAYGRSTAIRALSSTLVPGAIWAS